MTPKLRSLGTRETGLTSASENDGAPARPGRSGC
jgi:hypothetical protein